MAFGIALIFDDVTEQHYWAVNDKLGINRDGSGDWPEGMLTHAGGPTANGWIVMETWASKADHERFMATRLGAALVAVGVPEPVQVVESELVNAHMR